MQYFSSDFIQFFKDLSQNNNRDWFHTHKKRYEESIKNPFSLFITDLISELNNYEPIELEAKDCILRINRDIRFSKDKTPYNLHATAIVSSAGRKDKSVPGIYLRFSTEMAAIMGGCYGSDKDQLANIRGAIMENGKSLRKIIDAKSFRETYGEIRGEKMKRIPKEYQVAAEKNPLILNKQFYVVSEQKASMITSKDLMKQMIKLYKSLKPFNDFLKEAINR